MVLPANPLSVLVVCQLPPARPFALYTFTYRVQINSVPQCPPFFMGKLVWSDNMLTWSSLISELNSMLSMIMWYIRSHLIYPLTAKVVGAPQMISQPVFSIFFLFSTTLRDSANSRPVHYLMLSSHLFLCLP